MKKASSLLLALVLCLSLCACDKGDTPHNDSNNDPTENIEYTPTYEPSPTYDLSSTTGTSQSSANTNTDTHTHDWKEATCTSPKTCTKCGETEGAALEHQWSRDTCTDPYTCTQCSATSGEGESHQITDDVCTNCGKNLAQIENEPAYRYQQAIELLQKTYYSAHSNEDMREAYQLLAGLGDYKDAAQYLSRFTVLPNMLLEWTGEHVNVFGEVTFTMTGYYGYDVQGQMIFCPIYECCTVIDHFRFDYAYKYDDHGRVIQRTLKSNLTDLSQTLNTYNEDGKVIQTQDMDGSTTQSKTTHFYDEAGNEIRSETLNANGSTTVTTFHYDPSGNLIRKEVSEGSNDACITTYEYDSSGNCVRTKTGYTNEETYQYDTQGNLIKYTYSHYGQAQVYEYTYENGRRVSASYTDTYNVTCQTNYVYGDYYIYTPES